MRVPGARRRGCCGLGLRAGGIASPAVCATHHRAAGLAYRQAGPADGPPVLLVHGYPASSFMWETALDALARRGLRGIAPDLAGYGDSEPDPPGSWERHTEQLDRLRAEVGIERCALVLHDWGVMVGLRWACEHPEAVTALVISDGGFFADRRWHDLAVTMRTPDEGEALMESFTPHGFAALMSQVSSGISEEAIEEYWKAFSDPVRRRGHLELYRSGDFDKLEPYEGRVGALGVPTLVLWGERDHFAGVKMAHRFRAEIPGSKLIVLEAAGHFIWEDEPVRSGEAASDFLARALG